MVVEVGVWRSLGLGAGVVRGKKRGSSPLVITLVLSPELSVGDVSKTTGVHGADPEYCYHGGWM